MVLLFDFVNSQMQSVAFEFLLFELGYLVCGSTEVLQYEMSTSWY